MSTKLESLLSNYFQSVDAFDKRTKELDNKRAEISTALFEYIPNKYKEIFKLSFKERSNTSAVCESGLEGLSKMKFSLNAESLHCTIDRPETKYKNNILPLVVCETERLLSEHYYNMLTEMNTMFTGSKPYRLRDEFRAFQVRKCSNPNKWSKKLYSDFISLCIEHCEELRPIDTSTKEPFLYNNIIPFIGSKGSMERHACCYKNVISIDHKDEVEPLLSFRLRGGIVICKTPTREFAIKPIPELIVMWLVASNTCKDLTRFVKLNL